MRDKKRKRSFFQVFLIFWILVFLGGENGFALDEDVFKGDEQKGREQDSSYRFVRRSPVKKRRPLREEMQEIVKGERDVSEYSLVSSSKLPQEESLTLKEEEDLLSVGFRDAHAFLRLFNFYWSPLATRFCHLQLSSVIEGTNPSLNMIFRKDEETLEKPLIKIFFINAYSEAACLEIGNLNSTIKSAATFFKTTLEESLEQIFLKIFFRTIEEISEGESKESVQLYTSLESEGGVRKVVMRRPEKNDALYLEYLPGALK